jgi:hypothetical protein
MTPIRISLQIKSFVSGIRAFFNAYKKRVIAAGGYIEGEQCAIDKFSTNNLLKQASWVLIPEGIEEDIVFAQKPTDGLGDLTFTRASDATRTNSAGVIERTPWNLQSNSEMFTLSNWTKILTTIVANTITAPNGTLTADTLRSTVNGTSTRYRLYGEVNVVSGVTYTGSYYLKKANHRWIQIVAPNNFNTTAWANFDLEAGVVGNKGTGVVATIQSVGDGWYRCSVTGTASATASDTNFNLVLTNNTNSARYPSYISTTAEDVCYVWGAQVVEGTDAKPYFATTNRQDVPRLDYRNADGTVSTCPRLLLEPQRTNSATFSEQVNLWTQSGLSVTANQTISPSGYADADLVSVGVDASAIRHRLFTTQSITSGTAATGSFFLKANAHSWVQITGNISFPNDVWANFNLSNGTIGNTGGAGTTARIQDYGNGWYRCSVTGTPSSTGIVGFELLLTNNTNSGRYPSYQSTTAEDVCYIWGAQVENGAYATTYIPTTTAAVTRLADSANKSGISSLIGQTEGSFYAEVNISTAQSVIRSIFTIQDGSNYTRFRINAGGAVSFETFVGGSFVGQLSTGGVLSGNNKLAFSYKNGEASRVFLNGTLLGSTAVITTNPTGSQINLGIDNFNANQFSNGIAQAALFPTRLTNAQLAQLTTI